jgi:uncharacterized protein (TIGR02246 family)
MKILISAVIAVGLAGNACAQPDAEEKLVRASVQAFYDAFSSSDFSRATEFTTEDWNHINPGGGWGRGRDTVLKGINQAHATFLKGVTDTPDEISIRFATADVAVATVTSRISTYTSPDGVRHENERQIRTFVVVKRDGGWRIMQDHNTAIRR